MPTFKEALAKCPQQELEHIFHLWGMDGLNPKSRNTFLIQRIKDPIAARFVWEYLAPNEATLLYRTLTTSARSGVRRDITMKKLQMPEEQFQAVLANLERNRLLWEDTTKIRKPYTSGKATTNLEEDVVLLYAYEECIDALYTAGKEKFSSKSDRSQMSLEKILSTSFPASELDKLAQHYGVTELGANNYYYSRVDLRFLIEEELKQPSSIFEVLQHLEQAQRDVLKWLCEQEGKASIKAVRAHTKMDDNTLHTLLSKLEEYALAFDTFSEQERILFIPANIFLSVKQAMTQDPGSLVAATMEALETPPRAILSESTPIAYDIASIVGAVYQQNIEPTQAGTIPKRVANKLYPLLHGQPRTRYSDVENEYMEMVFSIAQELNVLRLVKPIMDSVKPHFEPGQRLSAWSHMDLTEQTHQLVECWLKSFSWLDVRGVHFHQYDPYYWNPMSSRTSILEQLRKCIPGQWYSTTGLLQAIWDKDPFELRPVQYNYRPVDRRKTAALRAKWNMCEGEVYLGLLASTLYELGIVALGYSGTLPPDKDKPTNPDFFMLTELGAAVLAQSEQPTQEKSKPSKTRVTPTEVLETVSADGTHNANGTGGHRVLILQPNFELLLLQPDMPTLYSVLPFAQVNQVDIVSRLTLTRTSVLHGIEQGMDIEQILQNLEAHSQKEVPQNVAYTLRDWVKLYKDVRITQVLLLEVSSEAVADEICTSPKFQHFNLRKLGSRQVVVSNDINLQDLRRTLEKENILVHISGDIVTQNNRYASTFGTLR